MGGRAGWRQVVQSARWAGGRSLWQDPWQDGLGVSWKLWRQCEQKAPKQRQAPLSCHTPFAWVSLAEAPGTQAVLMFPEV